MPTLHRPGDRPRLFARLPEVETIVSGIDADHVDLNEARAFARHICRARNAWSIGNYTRPTNRPFSKAEADNALRNALAALANVGGHPDG